MALTIPVAFPDAPKDRPYVMVNMVATIDGKILSGERDENVADLGSKNDKALMRQIEAEADALMLGARTLRATPTTWNPATPVRIVVTKSGNVPLEHKFLTGGESYAAMPSGSAEQTLGPAQVIRAGEGVVDVGRLLTILRDKDIGRLLVMGGSELNAQLFSRELVDELFLTVAPKIKLGRDVPTIADGDPLDREHLQRFRLLSHEAIGDELFLRYRREGI